MRREWTVRGYAFHFIATATSWQQQELLPRLRVQRMWPDKPSWGVGLGWFHGWIHLGWTKA